MCGACRNVEYGFQYNHCFGGTQASFTPQKELLKVSIQPLFRWNSGLLGLVMKIDEFQYNHCFGGTYFAKKSKLQALAFQYNHCFGGTLGFDLYKHISK